MSILLNLLILYSLCMHNTYEQVVELEFLKVSTTLPLALAITLQ